MNNCKDCKHFMRRTYQCVKSTPWETDTHLSCKEFEPKERTNRDVINAMSDEEFADMIFAIIQHRQGKTGYCRVYWQNAQRCRPELNCRQCLTAWMKAPAGKHQEVE